MLGRDFFMNESIFEELLWQKICSVMPLMT